MLASDASRKGPGAHVRLQRGPSRKSGATVAECEAIQGRCSRVRRGSYRHPAAVEALIHHGLQQQDAAFHEIRGSEHCGQKQRTQAHVCEQAEAGGQG